MMRSKISYNTPHSVDIASLGSSAILPPIMSLLDAHSPIREHERSHQAYTSPVPMSSSSQNPSVPELTDSITGSEKSSSRSNSYPTENMVKLPRNLASIMNMTEQGVKKFLSHNTSPHSEETMQASLPPIQSKMRPQRTQSHPVLPIDQKRLERLKNNREAASRCRVKQKQKIQKQEENLKWHQGENDKLTREVLDLKMKIMDLKMLIFGHHCGEDDITHHHHHHHHPTKPTSVKRSMSDQSSVSSNRYMIKRRSPGGPNSDDESPFSFSQRSRSDTSTP